MATSWIDAHRGETVVVKFGGNALIDDGLLPAFCEDIMTLSRAGIRVVVTHGGGPQISSELAARGIVTEFLGGQRVTTPEAVDVVREVLMRIGSELVTSLEFAGVAAMAIAGHTHQLLTARKAGTLVDGCVVDLGQVGEVVSVNTAAIQAIVDAGGVPVVSAMGRDAASGDLLNINADLAASSLAVALHADWLLLLTDVAGLYRDWPNRESLVDTISVIDVEALLPHLESGMIPKVTAARNAVCGGVGRAAIVDGRVPHVLTSAPFGSTGTMVTLAERNVS